VNTKPQAMAPTALTVRNQADILRLAIERQHNRCNKAIQGSPSDADSQPWRRSALTRLADADFLVVALARFQRLAEWALDGAFATPQLRAAVDRFKAAVPHLTDLRDTQEHFDEYFSNVGRRQKKGEPISGFGYGLNPTGAIVTYGGFTLVAQDAVAAAQDLHRAIRRVVDPIASKDVHGGPETVLIPHP
jgi:hypothetical protein